MSEGSTSIGSRIRTGLFRSNQPAAAGAAAPGGGSGTPQKQAGSQGPAHQQQQQALIDSLNAQVLTLTTSEKQLKERNEQLNLQKSLLQNLVDRIGDDDTSGEAGLLKDEVIRLQEETSKQQCELKNLTTELDETKSKYSESEQHATAFSKAVENANGELFASEQECKRLQGEASQAAESKALADRLTQELSSTQATVEALMSKVSRMDNEKEHYQHEITTLKTEVAELQEKCSSGAADANSAQSLTRAASVANVAELNEAKAEGEKMKSEIEKLRAEVDGLQTELNQQTERYAALKLESRETTTDKDEKITLLNEEVKSAIERIDDLTPALEAAQTAKETLACDLDDLKTSSEKTQLELQQALEELTIQYKTASEELQREKELHSDTMANGQEALEASKRQVDDLEASHVEAQEELESKQTALEVAVDKAEAEGRTRKMLKQECERLSDANQELESRLADIEAEANIRDKKRAALIKDLQNQMVSLERDVAEANADASRHKATADSLAAQRLRSSRQHADPNNGSGSEGSSNSPTMIGEGLHNPSVEAIQLAKDNNDLIQRVADLQEKVWMLEEAKTSYEQEMDRLSSEVSKKNAIVQAYFSEAAQKFGHRSIGSSLFGPKKEDVHSQMQSMLESTLSENMQCQAELRQKSSQLNNAMEVIRAAQEQGFEVLIEEDGSGIAGDDADGGELHDDVFE